MSFPVLLQQPPAKHFPNGLLEPEAKAVVPRWGLMLLLALVCFVPRAWIACHWDLVWTDSVTFLDAAKAIERGDLHAAFEETGLNVYPLILCGLRRLGMDWTTAGTWWSVLMATAAVLPLFGWVRRQFDDQVASAACLAYAFHGKLMAVSVLIIRDPTFWFLFNLALYLIWRAVTEVRWRLFLGAGLALTLAVHTRSEGWLLAVPLLLWPAFRWPALAGDRKGDSPLLCEAPGGPFRQKGTVPFSVAGRRWKLAGGTAVCLAMVPVCVALVNWTWLRDAPRWSLLREAHVQILRGWLGMEPVKSIRPGSPSPPSLPPAEPGGDGQVSMVLETDPMGFSPESLSTSLGKFVVTLAKSYTYLLGLLALLGIWGWWRVYLRRDHQTLLLMVLVLLTMIWVRNTRVRSDDIRYFFPMVLVSFPWIALGFLKFSDWGARLVSWGRGPAPRLRLTMMLVLAAVVAVFGLSDTNLASARFMREHVALGKWIRGRFGPNHTFVANIHDTRLVQYYSQGRIVGYLDLRACEGTDLPPTVRTARPDVLLLWTDPPSRDRWTRYAAAISAHRELGYRMVTGDQLPAEPDLVLVLVRIPPAPPQ